MKWIFVGYTGSKNPVQTMKKDPVHQTRNFKLDNIKNQVQIDSWYYMKYFISTLAVKSV